MTDEEQKLQGDKVVELLNEISAVKQSLLKTNDFGQANMLGRCYETIKTLHIINTEAVRENRLLTDHHRLYFAGQAM
jgi:negative regulator of replication initiation